MIESHNLLLVYVLGLVGGTDLISVIGVSLIGLTDLVELALVNRFVNGGQRVAGAFLLISSLLLFINLIYLEISFCHLIDDGSSLVLDVVSVGDLRHAL